MLDLDTLIRKIDLLYEKEKIMGVSKKIKRKSYTDFTIEEVFDLFRTEKLAYGITEKTINNYYDSLKRFNQVLDLNNPKLIEISKKDIITFIYEMNEAGVKPVTVNHYLRELRAFFNWCFSENYIDEKIEIKLIKSQESVKETYTEDELKKLLLAPTGDDYCSWRSWAIINWILATGNRERTVCNIKMCDLNILEHEIILQHTKNKKAQIIPMSSELATVLKTFIREFRSDANPEDYLFCNVAGEKLTENAMKLSIRAYNKSRNVSRTSIHALRHTFAKYWIRNNGDVFRLQKMLGHSSLDMTRVYVNMFSADLKEGFDDFSPLDKMVKKAGLKHKVKKQQVNL